VRFEGEEFGRYRIVSRLAGGAEMFLCEMKGAAGFERRVVLKKATGGGTLVVDRIRTAATMNHPNVVALVDMVRLDDGDYLVNEFVPGRSLRELQQRSSAIERPVPIVAVAGIGAQVARGLGFLHTRQPPRAHGSVTPRNLMLGEDGGVKLTDFGSSKWAREINAPLEVRRYRGHDWKPGGTAASDVFALGIILSELLTQTKDLPTQLEAILKQCAALDPTARPTARELENAMVQVSRSLAATIDDLSISHLLSLVFDKHERAEATQLTYSPKPEPTTWLAGHDLGDRLGRLGPYELARASRDGWPCLLKFEVDPSFATGKRLADEAQLLSRFRHPAVVAVRDLIKTGDGRTLLVLNGMGGETAAMLIERVGGLKLSLALSLTCDLLGGLAAIHAAGLSGPTIEPETIFVCSDSEPAHAVMLELGHCVDVVDWAAREADLGYVGRMLSVLVDAQRVPPSILSLQTWLCGGELPKPKSAVEARARTAQVLSTLL